MMSFRLSWIWNTRRFLSGSPATTIRSAYLPGSTVPIRSDIRKSAALTLVAESSTSIGFITCAFSSNSTARWTIFGGRAHLADRELRGIELVGRRHGPAGGHDLDLVYVAPELLAHGLAHLGLAVCDRADHADAALDRIDPLGAPALVAVAAGLRDVVARDEHPRPGIDPVVDGLAEPVVGAAGVAHGREPLQQALLGAAQRLGGQEARRQVAVLVCDVAFDRADVDVSVGEPRHQRRAPAVERRHRPRERADSAVRRDLLDAIVLDDDRGARHRVGARAVDEHRVGEDGQAHRGVTFASYIHTFSSARGVHSIWLVTP